MSWLYTLIYIVCINNGAVYKVLKVVNLMSYLMGLLTVTVERKENYLLEWCIISNTHRRSELRRPTYLCKYENLQLFFLIYVHNC